MSQWVKNKLLKLTRDPYDDIDVIIPGDIRKPMRHFKCRLLQLNGKL
jgi:hypothetical protein